MIKSLLLFRCHLHIVLFSFVLLLVKSLLRPAILRGLLLAQPEELPSGATGPHLLFQRPNQAHFA
jgi:hypothetical protein